MLLQQDLDLVVGPACVTALAVTALAVAALGLAVAVLAPEVAALCCGLGLGAGGLFGLRLRRLLMSHVLSTCTGVYFKKPQPQLCRRFNYVIC